MSVAAIALCSVLLVFAAVQSAVMVALAVAWRRAVRRPVPTYTPKAAVIVSLRGADPFLGGVLEALVRQDYPDYTVFVIVDHAADPAAAVVARVAATVPAGTIVASVLADPLPGCSLKCSALIQALRALDAAYEVAAFVDADAVPYPLWLRDMVAPLADGRVGATTGTRWYAPASAEWGTLGRYVWNVGAAVQTWLNGWAWGGSMAVRTQTVGAVGLIEALSGALSDDITFERQMRRHRLRVRFVPQAVMVNGENVSLSAFFRWLERQMIIAKLGGHGWPLVVVQAALMFFGQPAALLLIIAAAITGAGGEAVWCVGAVVAYWGSTAGCVVACERLVRWVLARTRAEIPPPNPALGWRLLPALALVHVVHPLACLSAALRRTISWRGITYEIARGGRIRMLGYRPYTPPATDQAAPTSVL